MTALSNCFSFLHIAKISATTATLTQVAGLLVQFNDVMPDQSRNAYASLLLVPVMDQLQFNPLLRQVKKRVGIILKASMPPSMMPVVP